MCKALASQVWDGEKRRLFVTLTFAQAGKVDGRVELRRFRKRWEHRWGAVHAVWWREFQKRQVVHYHFLAEVSAAHDVLLRKWLPGAWKGCGGGFVKVDQWRGEAKKLWKYAMKEVFNPAKAYQHELPVVAVRKAVDPEGELVQEDVHATRLGRWWGVWGCRDEWEWDELDRGAFMDLRRRARRWGCPLGSLRARGVCSWWAIAPPGLKRGLAGAAGN